MMHVSSSMLAHNNLLNCPALTDGAGPALKSMVEQAIKNRLPAV